MPADRIAGLVRGLVNAKTLTAIFEHLRHERQTLQLSIFVERSQDLFLGSDFDPFARA